MSVYTIIDKLRKKNKDFDVYDLLRRYVSYLPIEVKGITASTIVNYVGAFCSYFEFYDIDTHRRKSKVRLTQDYMDKLLAMCLLPQKL